MPEGTQPALVLDTEVAQSEPVHFAGFPGLWLTDEPIAVSELGFDSVDDAYARVDELGLPLAKTTVADGEGLMPEVANHVRAGVVPTFERVGDALEAVEGEEVPPEPSPFELAVAGNADVVIASLTNVFDVDQLDGLYAAEEAGKNRSTVLQALTDRRAELAPPADDDEGAGS